MTGDVPITTCRRMCRLRWCLAALVVQLVVWAGVTAPAQAAGPWWHLASETVPGNLPPSGQGKVLIVASNLGDAPVDGSKTPIVISDTLPPQLTVAQISGPTKHGVPVECSVATTRCSFSGILYPFEQITIELTVALGPTSASRLTQRASIEGGNAPSSSATLQLPVSETPTTFAASAELTPFEEDGTPATQAGSHPFELTTTLTMNQWVPPGQSFRQPVELPKDVLLHLPAGLLGNPTVASQCSMANFFTLVETTNLCPPSSVVGVATVVAFEPISTVLTKTVPVFSLTPNHGEPARFGFEVIGKIPVVIDTSVRSNGDYGVDVSVKNATETAGLLSSQVTLWGVPGDPRHDNARGWECVAGGFFAKQVGKPCPESNAGLSTQSFLTLPSACAAIPAAEPVVFPVETDSWAAPGSFVGSSYEWISDAGEPIGFTGCSAVGLTPGLNVAAEEHAASTPSALDVGVSVPDAGLLDPEGLAQADVRDTTVTLPPGVEISPSAANGLGGCPEGPQEGFEGIGFTGFAKYRGDEQAPATATFTGTFGFVEEDDEGTRLLPSCPDASKLGTVEIETPLLPNKLAGYVYLADPAPNGEAGRNPFNSLVAVYLVARDPVSGVLVKLAGEGVLDEHTLRVATTFKNTPQVPFSHLRIHLFGGPRASLSTPAKCGGYQADASFTPWSGTGPVSVRSPAEDFGVTEGVGGSACPGGALGFSPGFTAFSTTPQAGAFTGFHLELTHRDGDQALAGLSMHLPEGVAAMLSSVELCSEAQAQADACPVGSEVGKATAIAGLGSEPIVQEGGRVFITGPYGGAPFGLGDRDAGEGGPVRSGVRDGSEQAVYRSA